MKKLLLLLLLATAPAFAQNTDLILNPGPNYVDAGRGVPWSAINRTYVLVPQNPNTSICFYVVNNNPTSSHTFTLNVFQSPDPRVADYSNNKGRYSAVTAVGTPSPVAASAVSSVFVQTTAAAAVAFSVSGAITQAGSPDTADLFLVQTSSGTCGAVNGALEVQGTVLPGANVSGNPVLIGGKDVNGLSQFFAAGFGSTGGQNLSGIAIGVGSAGGQASISTISLPNGNDALAVIPFTTNDGTNYLPAGSSFGSAASATQNPRGMFTRDAGFYSVINTSGVTGTGTIPIWGPQQNQGAISSCYFSFQTNGSAGTTPTLDIWIQDSGDGVTGRWTDRVHFTQATTGQLVQYAAITSSAGIAPTSVQNKALAAGSKVDGPIGPNGQIAYTVGGTGASYLVFLVTSCK